MKFLPDVKYHREAQNPKIYLNHGSAKSNFGQYLSVKHSNTLFSGNATSGHASLTKFAGLSVSMSEINTENFRLIS